MGIFDKACPQCTADNAAGAIRCACGFIFGTEAVNGSGPSPQETAEEERLFQEYLAARVSQAIEQATVAAHAADVEPENERRAIEAIRAQETVEKAKAELVAQHARTAKAAEAARKAELMVGAVPIKTKRPANGSSVAKFGVAEVVEDDRLYKDYLVARRAQATEKKKTPIQNPAAGVKPAATTNEQIWPREHEKDEWQIKPGVGKVLSLTATEAKRYPEWKRNGQTRTLPKNEVLALYSLQTTSEKQVPKKSGAKISRPVTTTRNRPRPRPPSVVVPAMKTGLGVAARTTAKGTKVISKGIVKLISKTIQAAQHHARKEAIPTLHAGIDVHPRPVGSRHAHGHKAKRAAARSSATPSHGGRQTPARRLVKPNRAQQLPTKAASIRPQATAPIKKNGVANRSVNTRLNPNIAKNNPIQRPRTQPKPSGAVPKQASIPGAAFRAAQAAKIAKAVEAAQAMEEPTTNRDAFHAKQAQKIEQALNTAQVMKALSASRECPLCTGALAADATDCRCGWTASTGELEMPGLELNEQERIDTVGLPEEMSCPVECPVCTATVPAGAPNCGCGWAVPVGDREMPRLSLTADERSAIQQGEKIKRG